MEEFLSKVAEVLEADSVTPDFEFRAIDDWNSLKGFALMVLLESDYGKQMSVEEFLSCSTVGELATVAGVI